MLRYCDTVVKTPPCCCQDSSQQRSESVRHHEQPVQHLDQDLHLWLRFPVRVLWSQKYEFSRRISSESPKLIPEDYDTISEAVVYEPNGEEFHAWYLKTTTPSVRPTCTTPTERSTTHPWTRPTGWRPHAAGRQVIRCWKGGRLHTTSWGDWGPMHLHYPYG